MNYKYQDMAKTGNTKPSRFISSVSVILYFYFFLGSFVGAIPLIFALFKNKDAFLDYTNTGDVMSIMQKYIDPMTNYVATNLTIYLMLAGTFIAVKFIHYRTFTSLITTKSKVQWSRFWIGFLVYGVLISSGVLVDYFISPETYSVSFDPSKFWIALPLILIMTPIQTTTEELVFRGYVIQGFGLKIKNGVLLSLISGILFTIPHLMNPEIYASGKLGFFSTVCTILNYFTVGAMLALVTIKTNSLEVAMGAHAVNNLVSFLLVGYPDSVLATNTVFFTSKFEPVGTFTTTIVTGVLFYLLTVFFVKEPAQAEEVLSIEN